MTLNKRLQQHYDKILHITCTFTLLAFAHIWLPIGHAITVVVTLQVVKTMWNVSDDRTYRPWGDWLANAIGYALYAAYWLARG